MLMLFRVCRDERQARWVVLVEDRLYGEYLDKERAVLDLESPRSYRGAGFQPATTAFEPAFALDQR